MSRYLHFIASALSLLGAGAGVPEQAPEPPPDPVCVRDPAVCRPPEPPEENRQPEAAPPSFQDIIPPTYRDQNPPMGPPSV